jgi:RNase H-fold protein (predicted Holliday junction resolvase)
LAIREKDWRVRKARLDAAAAAIILQDYLDSRS